ncbi:hypothetical protein H8R13_01995 [Morganella morganii]|uniref:hypothetical protein n=1 Tax=Morganella morganii TaxID=582 RepID=UPI00164C7675|nr:hypothetical protein [Morganella morganii]MBC4010519.1 hypothetical protein [Morganella morganii]
MLIKNKLLVVYLSFSISVIFYYLEMVHAFFFRIYSHGVNNVPIIKSNILASWIFFSFTFVLGTVIIHRKQTEVSKRFRAIVYLVFPYIISVVVWYFFDSHGTETHYQSVREKSQSIGDFFIFSFIAHGIFFIPLVAYTCDFLLSFMFCRNKKTPPG